jgi:hypothetical protein
MALNLASPGIVVREVDLTVGRVGPTSNKVGAIVAPFAKGPVGSPTLVETEQDLLSNFGEPYAVDKHYEHWLTASSYLAYGGSLRVVRSDDTDLKNGFVGTATSVKIKSLDHYIELGFSENTIGGVTVVARNPGSWSNGIRIGMIDAKADQILGVTTASVIVGHGVTQSVVGKIRAGAGGTSVLDGFLKGVVTEIGAGNLSVKVLSHVSAAGTETIVDYQPAGVYSFSPTTQVGIITANGTSVVTPTPTTQLDWFDQQNLTITTAPVGSATTEVTVPWNTVSDRPFTSDYANARGARFDEFHIVVIDSTGSITGNAGTILEKHLNISKASDAQYSVGSPAYWRKYLENNSTFIFGGSAPTGITSTGFSSGFVPQTDFAWDQEADSAIFGAIGTRNFVFNGGKNYDGSTTITANGALTSRVADISSGYDLFENTDNYKVDFLLMGSANYAMENAQALAEKLISVAELRKDALAFISPYRGSALTDTSDQTAVTVRSASDITDKVLQFYSPIASSTYAVFDTGYKYMYDRFSDTFRYVPLNGDIAGTCARNDINNFPWYSPAGTSRGAILNAVKLAYNPSRAQRDRLYSNRINPIIFSPGAGIVLFGDKTGYAKASAFDRINVRRLFIYLETAISTAAKDQLFEFNDEITRTNFVNIVEPFLRDVQAKRGIFDYVVVCDETNNTAAVIDSNEFVADIYIKPARSINFIGLTFVATRTGVSFDEVIGQF